MATQYTTILKLALPVQGELSGTWGDVVNNNITAMVEEAVAGRKVINTWTANSHTLTSADGTTSESRAAILTLTDTGTALSGAGTVVCPAASKIYIVENGTAQVITVKTASGTGIAVPVGKNMVVFCDGTNVEEGISNIASLSIGGDGATVTGIKDEDDMSSNSATKLATQQSIKAYVDSQVTAQDLDVTDGSTTISIDLDSESLGILGGTGVDSTASGNNVTVAIDATVATLTGSQTLTNKTLTSPDINAPDIDGGAIDDAVIGGATPAAGSFTTIAASGNVDFNADVDVDGTLETDALTINGVASVPFEAADHSKLDGIEANADVTDTANVTSAGALMDSEVTNLAQVKAFDSSDYATAAQGTTADAALPRTGGAMTGAITTNSTFDGRDVSADGTKLDGIEANADVTDATNVTAAGALMDSELTSIASVKALNQGVATTDSPTFAGITTSGTTNTANLTVSGAQGSDGQVLTSTGSGVQWEDAAGGGVDGIGSSTTTQIITLSSANKVGIGQNVGNALALLHVYQASGSGDMFKVQNAGGDGMLMDSSGNLGIGTNSPNQLLDVDGTINAVTYRVGNNTGNAGQVLTSQGSNNATWSNVAVNGVNPLSTSGYCINLVNDNDNYLVVGDGVNGTIYTPERPAAIIWSDYFNNPYVPSTYGKQVGYGGMILQKNSTSTGAVSGISYVVGTNSGSNYNLWNNYVVKDSGGLAYMVWASTLNQSGGYAERMRLEFQSVFSSKVNLGLNKDNPTYNLDVNGSCRISGATNGDAFYVHTNQNVGIGTASPGSKFTVVGGDLAVKAHPSAGFTDTLFVNYNTYKVGIGTPNPSHLLHVDGDAKVGGALTKGSGSFRIDHPLPAKTETHELVHSFIEGPQADNIYRGTVDLVDGSATVNIDTAAGMTEGTYVVLNTNTQCFTSNESGWTAIKGSVSGNTLTITAQENTCTDTVSWMVVGERKDPHMIDTHWTDENGKVIVEPLKENN